jgi:hypothetical protein
MLFVARAEVADVAGAAAHGRRPDFTAFRSLSARTRPDNERSMAVLRRNGFREPEESAGDGPEAIRTFVKLLEPPDAGAGRRT